MSVFFTSDLHLGHARINELSGRPFSNVPAMNAALIKAWNARVTDADTVWVLGDVCMGKLDDSLALIPLLAGRKLLMPGNHDRCWEGNGTKAKATEARYLDAGFAEIVHGPLVLRRTGTMPAAVLMSHFPYQGDSGDKDRYTDARPADFGYWLLHGHVHEKWRQRSQMINVGVDAWAGRPVHADTIAEMIAAGPADLGPKPWHTA